MNSIGRLLFSSLTGVVCEKFVGALAAIASNHLFARVYGVQLFGSLQFALSLASVVGSAALVFSAQSIVPILGKHPRLRHLVLYRAFRLRLASTLGVMVLFALVVWMVMSGASAELTLIACLLLIVEPIALGSLMAYSERAPWIVTRAKVLASGLRVLWLYAAARWSLGAVVASLAWPIEACIASIGPFRRYQNLALSAPKRLVGDDVVTRTLVVRGLKFWPAIAASVLILRVDRVVLAALISNTELGIYSAAASLVEQWNSVGAALALALAPGMVFTARNEVQLKANALKLGIYLGLLGVVAFIGAILVGHQVFHLIYGSGFESGAKIMIFATGCSIVTFADAGLTTWMIAARRYRLALIKQAITLTAIVLAPFVVPKAAMLYAPSGASAISMVFFWAVIYARTAHEQGKTVKVPVANSLPDTNA